MPRKKKEVADAEAANDQSNDQGGELRTMSSSLASRNKLDADVADFLGSGGKIVTVERDVMADPPRKPVSNYGSRPI